MKYIPNYNTLDKKNIHFLSDKFQVGDYIYSKGEYWTDAYQIIGLSTPFWNGRWYIAKSLHTGNVWNCSDRDGLKKLNDKGYEEVLSSYLKFNLIERKRKLFEKYLNTL